MFFGGLSAAALILAPIAFATSETGLSDLKAWDSWACIIMSGYAHTLYDYFLACGYRLGDLSRVYPVARGSGVALTATLAVPLFGEGLALIGAAGVACIVAGILAIGLAKVNRDAKKVPQTSTMGVVGRDADTGTTAIEIELHSTDVEPSREDLSGPSDPGIVSVESDTQAIVGKHADLHPSRRSSACRICGVGMEATSAALVTGTAIACYSLVDSLGVKRVEPLKYMLLMKAFELSGLAPLVFCTARGRADVTYCLKNLKLAALLVGVGSVGTYIMILYAYQHTHASYVVAVRECSVVIGAGLGFTFLGERPTRQKLIGLLLVVAGIVLVKLAPRVE